MHRLTWITLEAGVRRFENLQNFLISRKLPPIQITVTMTLMLIKMPLWFLAKYVKRIAGISVRKVSQRRIIHLGASTTDLFSSNRLNSNEVSFGNVGLFVYIYIFASVSLSNFYAILGVCFKILRQLLLVT